MFVGNNMEAEIIDFELNPDRADSPRCPDCNSYLTISSDANTCDGCGYTEA
jgi:hypothetical protein